MKANLQYGAMYFTVFTSLLACAVSCSGDDGSIADTGGSETDSPRLEQLSATYEDTGITITADLTYDGERWTGAVSSDEGELSTLTLTYSGDVLQRSAWAYAGSDGVDEISYTFDGDRLASATDESIVVTFSYDDNGVWIAKSVQDIPDEDSNGGDVTESTVRYDENNRISTIEEEGATTSTTSFTYDASGNLDRVAEDERREISYTYDSGRLASYVISKSADPQRVVASIDYDTEGRIQKITQVPDEGGKTVFEFSYAADNEQSNIYPSVFLDYGQCFTIRGKSIGSCRVFDMNSLLWE